MKCLTQDWRHGTAKLYHDQRRVRNHAQRKIHKQHSYENGPMSLTSPSSPSPSPFFSSFLCASSFSSSSSSSSSSVTIYMLHRLTTSSTGSLSPLHFTITLIIIIIISYLHDTGFSARVVQANVYDDATSSFFSAP